MMIDDAVSSVELHFEKEIDGEETSGRSVKWRSDFTVRTAEISPTSQATTHRVQARYGTGYFEYRVLQTGERAEI
jgi:hypothetical protein